MTSTLTYVRRARKHGARYCFRIIHAARSTGLPLSIAFALVEQESSFRNIFGHDPRGMFAGDKVTRRKATLLYEHVKDGGVSNGVGLTQLTWVGYLRRANELGGLHRPYIQCIVGFSALKSLHADESWWRAFHDYNGSGSAANRYADSMWERKERWHRILTGEE